MTIAQDSFVVLPSLGHDVVFTCGVMSTTSILSYGLKIHDQQNSCQHLIQVMWSHPWFFSIWYGHWGHFFEFCIIHCRLASWIGSLDRSYSSQFIRSCHWILCWKHVFWWQLWQVTTGFDRPPSCNCPAWHRRLAHQINSSICSSCRWQTYQSYLLMRWGSPPSERIFLTVW